MGKTIKIANLATADLLQQLHNKIELHFMLGLSLARVLDVRELYRSGELHDDNLNHIEHRICKIADDRKILRSDIVTIKDLICTDLQKWCDLIKGDIDVLESSI